MDWTVAEGGTYEEAVNALLNALGADRSEVELDHLGVHRKFLGFGKAVIRVRGRLKRESFEDRPQKRPAPEIDGELMKVAEKARDFLADILEKMGVEKAAVSVIARDDGITLDIVSDSGGLIIGRKGDTLEALQMLVEIFANRLKGDRVNLIVDAENYRSRRREKLINIARQSARKAVNNGSKVYLGPMKSSERKLIHSCLHNNPRVQTKSEGEGDSRQVVVIPV